jgi:hypothetical protein
MKDSSLLGGNSVASDCNPLNISTLFLNDFHVSWEKPTVSFTLYFHWLMFSQKEYSQILILIEIYSENWPQVTRNYLHFFTHFFTQKMVLQSYSGENDEYGHRLEVSQIWNQVSRLCLSSAVTSVS